MKRFLIRYLFFCGLLFISIVFLLTFQHRTHPSQSKSGPPVVHITKDGFSPQTLTVMQGTTVTFINDDTTSHWPASNNHPLHELYPEFDSKYPIPHSESWSFVFSRSGTWPYHDHSHPYIHGEIVVTPKKGYSASNLSANELLTAQQKITIMTAKEGPLKTWNYFKLHYSNTLNGAHDIAHFLGGKLYQQYKLDALSMCDTSFAFGCYHGLIEELIKEEGIGHLSDLVDKCQALPEFQGQLTCYHGIGHGLLSYYGYNLKQALSTCDQVIPNPNYNNCYTGVFMEDASVNFRSAKPDDPLYPCSTMESKYQSACLEYHMSFLGYLYKYDIKKMADACSLAKKQELVRVCIRGIAAMIAQKHMTNIADVQKECNLINGDNKYFCMISAATELIFQKVSYEDTYDTLCKPLPENLKQECIKGMDIQKSIQTKDS